MLMGQREYARHRGCALRAVQKAIEANRISLVEVDGAKKIDSDQADRDWLSKTDPARQSLLNSSGPAARRATVDRLPGDEPPADDPGDDDDDPHTAAYRQARAERERIRVDREQIELDQLKGKYIEVAEASRMVFTAFRALRDAVLNVPARIKDQAAAETDAFRVEQLLDNELGAALAGFNPNTALRDVDDDEAS